MLAPIVDAKVNDSIQLRTRIVPLWQHAFSPMLISKEFSTWLKLTPEKIVMSPLLTANNRVLLSVGVITGAAITVGPKPAAAPVKALPPVQQLPVFDKRFHIQLATEIVFADLVTALNPVLLNKTFGDDRKITVNSFNLKGEDGRLAIDLIVTGDFNGEIIILAKPVYNPQSNSLTFENVDFDTHTERRMDDKRRKLAV
ncbi:DUF4403 family protein [Desulfobacterium sp. N47]|uniref:Uncharacterized protein n=1 Tax=uncultured Desulfobacterium sp. TaxID=201089 RepID=E1YD83_9BACT|nr:hypothetical protein N47_G38510 [uncultured Desulfobacterium sp.]